MENQNTEWKQSWRDEYLEWICGFANAQGGVLEIGRNDNGVVIGLTDSRKLLETLPNKIRTTMGIIADVNLLTEDGKEYIAVKVAARINRLFIRRTSAGQVRQDMGFCTRAAFESRGVYK